MNRKASLITAIIFVGLWAAPGQAQEGNRNYNALFLTPGHSQTLTFELDNSVFNDPSEFFTCYLMTMGAGTITVRVGPASSVGEFSGMIYSLVGMIGAMPVMKYAYNAETIIVSADVPAVGPGILFTGIIAGIGSPDFPIIMSMVVTFLAKS
jgi:hypothetical protein